MKKRKKEKRKYKISNIKASSLRVHSIVELFATDAKNMCVALGDCCNINFLCQTLLFPVSIKTTNNKMS